MKLFLKRHATGVIAVVLLSIIAVLGFFLFSGSKTYVSVLTEEDLEPLSGQKPIEETPAPTKPTPDYQKVLPKAASASEEYLYVQRACGVGNVTLKQTHTTPYGLYVVCETDCIVGDLEGAKPTVGVLKLDTAGNITDAFSLSTPYENAYVTSQMTALGLVIVTASESKNYLYVNILSYDFSSVKTRLVSYADNAKIFSTASGFLLFCCAESGGILYEYDQENFRFFSLPAKETVSVFEYGDRYSVFMNTGTGYANCEILKKTFVTVKERAFSGGKLLYVAPVQDDGQKYLAIVEDGGLFVKKYTPDTLEELDSRSIGSLRSVGIGTDGEKTYLAAQGAMNGIVEINKDLSTTFSVTDGAFLPTALADSYYEEGAFYLLALGTEKTALIKMTADITTTVYLPKSDDARLCPNVNGTIAVVQNGTYYDSVCVDIYGLTK